MLTQKNEIKPVVDPIVNPSSTQTDPSAQARPLSCTDALSSLSTTDLRTRHVNSEAEVAGVARCSDNPTREREISRRFTSSIASLNLAIGAAAGAIIAAHAVAVSVVLPNLILKAPQWLLAYGATVIGLGVVMRVGLGQLGTRMIIRQGVRTEESAPLHERVAQSLERLSSKFGRPLDVHISIREKDEGEAYFVDRLFRRDVLAISACLIRRLTNPELDALVAHELCHSNRTFSKFHQMRVFLHCFSSPAVFWGVALPVYGALAQVYGGVLAGGLAAATATTAWMATYSTLLSLARYACRKNELKTDLRAVKITVEPDEYISLLSKAEYARTPSRPATPLITETHPGLQERCRAIREVFGE